MEEKIAREIGRISRLFLYGFSCLAGLVCLFLQDIKAGLVIITALEGKGENFFLLLLLIAVGMWAIIRLIVLPHVQAFLRAKQERSK